MKLEFALKPVASRKITVILRYFLFKFLLSVWGIVRQQWSIVRQLKQ